MTESKPKYANFPERDLKVLIGPNIGVATTKTLTRLSIGTYEMSFLQQEKGKATRDAARVSLNLWAKQANLTVTSEESREFVGVLVAQNAEVRIQVWVTTPFELTQASHIVWARYTDLTSSDPLRTGVAFKLATAFTADDVANVLRAAQKNVVAVPAGEAYTLKGNPPPRFQKKAAAGAETPAGEAPAAEGEAAAEPVQP